MTVAVVDLGTISTRLLIVGDERERVAPVVTTMGTKVDATGLLSAEGLARVERALQGFRPRLDDAGVSQVRVIATSAARDAGNRDDLLAVVDRVLGVPTDVLSGEEEGRLAFAGALAGLPADLDSTTRALVLDIGGGSTEFSVGSAANGLEGVYSADVGAARVTDSYLESDPPRPEELSAALSVIQLHLDDASRELVDLAGVIDRGPVIGLGGTITTMAAVELGLATYDSDRIHGFELDQPAAEDVFRTLATETAADRAFNPGLPPDRVELIVGGAAIVVEAMRHLAIETIRVSEFDLLDGAAAELRA